MISPRLILAVWEQSVGLFHVTVIVTAGLLLWLAVTGVERLRFRRSAYNQTPQALFGELCRAHGLSRSQRRLLGAISRQTTRGECCRVFLDRQVIEQFAESHPIEAEQCRALLDRLFGK